MAVFHGNFYAKTLFRNVELHVILPLPGDGGGEFRRGERFQTLYLLHGAYGDGTDWLRRSRIECYAETHHLAVVTAPACNSFYRDLPGGEAFERFFARELPDMAEAIFPLSPRREDRFAAGLSMGGYGALRLALKYPERFAAAASLSGAFDLSALEAERGAEEGVFRGLSAGGRETWLLEALAAASRERGAALPPVFLSCGTEDFTLEANRAQRASLEALGVRVTYEEHPGAHEWDYWDRHIQRVLAWLPR